MDRSIRFRPGFHRCHPDSSQDYGISDPVMTWVLRDGDVAVSWHLFTGWGMPDEAFHAANPGCTHAAHQGGWPYRHYGADCPAQAGAVDFHSATPRWEGHEAAGGGEPCFYIGKPCYPDVTFLGAQEVFDTLRVEGEDATWDDLARRLKAWTAYEG